MRGWVCRGGGFLCVLLLSLSLFLFFSFDGGGETHGKMAKARSRCGVRKVSYGSVVGGFDCHKVDISRYLL